MKKYNKLSDKNTKNSRFRKNLTHIFFVFLIITLSILPPSLSTPYDTHTHILATTNFQFFTNLMFYIKTINLLYAFYLSCVVYLSFSISKKMDIMITPLEIANNLRTKTITMKQVPKNLLFQFLGTIIAVMFIYAFALSLGVFYDGGNTTLGSLTMGHRGWVTENNNGQIYYEDTGNFYIGFQLFLNIILITSVLLFTTKVIFRINDDKLSSLMFFLFTFIIFSIGIKYYVHSWNLWRIFIPAFFSWILLGDGFILFASALTIVQIFFIIIISYNWRFLE